MPRTQTLTGTEITRHRLGLEAAGNIGFLDNFHNEGILPIRFVCDMRVPSLTVN
jgi:hypothetical protein